MSPLSPLFQENPPAPGEHEWMRWFKNYKCGDRFDPDKPTNSTDFCLQLALSLQNFYTWRNEGTKMLASRYKRSARRAKGEDVKPPIYKIRRIDEDIEEFKIQRDFPEK